MYFFLVKGLFLECGGEGLPIFMYFLLSLNVHFSYFKLY